MVQSLFSHRFSSVFTLESHIQKTGEQLYAATHLMLFCFSAAQILLKI